MTPHGLWTRCRSPLCGREGTFVDRLSAALVISVLHGMTVGLLCPRQPVARPRRRTFPAQFKSRKEWLAWCEEDRRSELAEMQEAVWSQDYGSLEHAA